VIGIGLNVNNAASAAPEALRRRVATLGDLTGREHDRTAVLRAVLGNLADVLQILATGQPMLPAVRMSSPV
jgi:biotin-(acetyl-CoA carboxylase) ligase